MHSLQLSVVTTGRKELHASNTLPDGKRMTNAVTIRGFCECSASLREEDPPSRGVRDSRPLCRW
jgi:hypothetical protein